MNALMSMSATYVGWLDLIVVVLTIILYSLWNTNERILHDRLCPHTEIVARSDMCMYTSAALLIRFRLYK